jgi:hypothetical protein
VEAVLRVADLTGSGAARDPALVTLRSRIRDEPDGLFGIDAPLAVPAALRGPQAWSDWLLDFDALYPDAEFFRKAMSRAAGGRETLRATEREARVPFASYNLRLFRQTYYLLSRVIAPLIRDRAASVLPMQDPAPGRACLIEVCPASSLRRLDWYTKPYKGKGPETRRQRAWILNRAIGRYRLTIDPVARGCVTEDGDGDALDSLLAACTVLDAIHGGLSRSRFCAEADERREGRVYLPMG